MTEEEKDKCVGAKCGQETPYTKSTPIYLRLHYIETGGQLCAKCYVETYGSCGCHECEQIIKQGIKTEQPSTAP